MSKPKISSDGRTITVRVPISIQRRGGRKLVLAPDGADVPASPVARQIDNAMVKAIARALRWRDMLEKGQCGTIREIATAEKINETYVGRVLRLTLLAPQIVEAIVDGRWAAGVQLDRLMRRWPVEWEMQIDALLAKPARGVQVDCSEAAGVPERTRTTHFFAKGL